MFVSPNLPPFQSLLKSQGPFPSSISTLHAPSPPPFLRFIFFFNMSSPQPLSQELYIRTRENPYFNGPLVKDGALVVESSNFDLGGISGIQKISWSKSDIGDSRHKNLDLDIFEKFMESPSDDSVLDLILEPFNPASYESWSNVFPNIQSESSFHLGNSSDSIKDPLHHSVPSLMRTAREKSYKVNKIKTSLSKIPLPQSAASFYNGHSPRMEIVESCESINSLNLFLKSKRDEVDAGVPGRFLHTVFGQDISDVGSVASTIMYAFYLNEMLESHELCTVPVINMKRTELNSHAELKWLLDSCQIDQSFLIFIDEALKESVIEIFNCRQSERVYPWVKKVTVGQECSSCTLIAEKFAMTSPEILAGQGFSRLLLAGILLDTGNLSSPHSTTKDKYMATLLVNGAGRFGCNGLYQILRYKLYDISELRVSDILGRDFKKWTRVGKLDNAGSRLVVSQVGMSSIGISVEQLLAHGDASTREIKHFQQMEKLRLLMIVSGYYDHQKNFKREILVSTESVELMKNLLFFFNSNASQLPLKVLHQPGLGEEMRAFEIDKVTSRKTIERLMEEFGGASKVNVGSRPKQQQYEYED
ncbi:exopolyphosphatase PRUNE1-like isoform X2 [Durio zibethinus]|uniref:Exopolyphosphatase PRUNE1-like isoform X2 n=1 Tax=Durio zibethinus TaxID=66656 RepID=A0A6P5WYS1_DURZI|nr:exopolyphosphatase PRUNE1-like isoform X2 [Durio zibethinus]